MCLGIPGKLLEVRNEDALPMGKVEFGGITKDICLAYLPEAHVGDYVLVHVGFAISKVDETEAQEIFQYIQQIGELSDLSDQSDPSGQSDLSDASEQSDLSDLSDVRAVSGPSHPHAEQSP